MRYLLASMFTVTFAMGMMSLAIPVYAKQLGAGYIQIGLLGVTYTVFNILLSIPSGRLADVHGRKPLLALGLFSISCVFMMYALRESVGWLLFIRLLQGAAEAPIWVNAQSAVADLSMRTIRGRAMGAYGASWGIGFASGPLVGGFLYGPIGPAGIFIASGVISLVATFLVLFISLPQPRHQVKRIKLTGWGGTCFLGLVYCGILGVLFTLFPAYGRDLGMSARMIGGFLTLFTAIRAALFVPMGKLSDRFGSRPIILGGLAGAGVALASMALVGGYLLLGVVISLLAASGAAIYPAALSMASEMGGSQNRGYALGIFNAVSMVGWGILPGIGGVLADVSGPTAPYVMCAIIAFAALPLMLRLLPKS